MQYSVSGVTLMLKVQACLQDLQSQAIRLYIDGIIASKQKLNHVPFQKQIIGEIHRSSKPHAYLVHSLINPADSCQDLISFQNHVASIISYNKTPLTNPLLQLLFVGLHSPPCLSSQVIVSFLTF